MDKGDIPAGPEADPASPEAVADRSAGIRGGEERGGDSSLPEASAFEASAVGPGGDGRIVGGRNREAHVRRTGGRKLFDAAAKRVFLEWFAATCNAGWAAERAGFNYQTIWKHRMKDPAFADAFDRAE